MSKPLLLWVSQLRKLLLTLFAVFVSLSLSAQITVSEKNRPIKDILKSIEQSSDYSFFYSEDLKGLDAKASLIVKDATIETAMKELFKNTDIDYQIMNDKLVVLSIKAPEASGADIVVTGVVRDERGEPLVGATVTVGGTNRGMTTDLDGRFRVEAKSGSTLTFSYLGLETKNVKVSNSRSLDIVLPDSSNQLDDVVVIGYGALKKSDLTGAVTSVKTDNLPLASSTSIATMLGGRAAGVTATQVSAQPGGGVDILVRGAGSLEASNRPLYVIDGFPVSDSAIEPGADNRYSNFGSLNPLNSINPNDIESIEILKDASSSAIYGARAANGVVLITTKRGKEGKAVVSYQGNYGIQQISRRIDMLNATEFMEESNKFSYEKWLFDNRTGPYGDTDQSGLKPWTPMYSESEINSAGRGTDWYDHITRTGSVNQHNVSITGGTQDLKYMASFNYYDQQGVVKNSDFNRMTGRVNIDHRINRIFSYGINATMSYIENSNIPLGPGDFEDSGLINSALTYDPTVPVKDDKGNYVLSPNMAFVPNPVSLLEITDYTKTRRALVNAYVQADIIEGLTAKLNLGFDDQQANRNYYIPKTTLYGKQEGGKAGKAIAQQFDKLIEATLTYNTTFKDIHKLTVLAGYSFQQFEYESTSAANNQFFTDLLLYNSLASGEAKRPMVSSGKSENKQVSYFGRINYNLMEKYLFTLTVRMDGSSRFGDNNRYGVFPSGSFAWRVKQEDFLKPVDWLSDLKLRVGFGQTGNSEIGDLAFSRYTSAWKEYVFGDNVYTGTARDRIANPNLKWETTTELNVGLDFGFFNQRLTGSVDFFTKQIDDLLGYKKLKSFMEVQTVAANIGKTQSKGVEVSLRSVNVNTSKVLWTTDLNFTRYVDRWLERNPDQELKPWQKNDDPIRSHYGYVYDGILGLDEAAPSYMDRLLPGQAKVKDVNGYVRDEFGNLVMGADGKVQYTNTPDGILDEADIVLLGTTDPGFSIGFGNTLQVGGFDFNIFFYGMFNRLVYNATRDKYSIYEMRRILTGQNFMTEVKDRWSSENPNGTLPSGFVTDYPQPSLFWEKGWFIRCKNITVGYTFPHKWVGKVFSSARVFAEVGNPFVITPYTGNDPETDFKAGYPNQRSYMFGLDITF